MGSLSFRCKNLKRAYAGRGGQKSQGSAVNAIRTRHQTLDILTLITFDDRHVLLLQLFTRTKAVVYSYRTVLNKVRKEFLPVMIACRLAKEADVLVLCFRKRLHD